MALPIFQSTIDSLREDYKSGDAPSCDFFEFCSYREYTVDEVEIMVSKEAAKEYAQWIYENEK